MKTIQSVLLALALVPGLIAQPLPTNPPATNFKPTAVSTNGIVPLTGIASPGDNPATPNRTVRTITNAAPEFPAFPAFPAPPPSRRSLQNAAGNPAGGAVPTAVPGNVATPIDPEGRAGGASYVGAVRRRDLLGGLIHEYSKTAA